jgi:hypothetical protein
MKKRGKYRKGRKMTVAENEGGMWDWLFTYGKSHRDKDVAFLRNFARAVAERKIEEK